MADFVDIETFNEEDQDRINEILAEREDLFVLIRKLENFSFQDDDLEDNYYEIFESLSLILDDAVQEKIDPMIERYDSLFDELVEIGYAIENEWGY